MWMSDARSSTARWMTRLTRRITGASEARSRRCSISSTTLPSPSAVSMMAPIALRPWPNQRSMTSSISERRPTCRRTGTAIASCTASAVYGSCGSLSHRSSTPSCSASGQAWNCLRKRSDSGSASIRDSGGASGTPLPSSSGSPSTSAQACAWSRSDTRPSRTSSGSRLPPASRCSGRARARSASFSRPLRSNSATMRVSASMADSSARSWVTAFTKALLATRRL